MHYLFCLFFLNFFNLRHFLVNCLLTAVCISDTDFLKMDITIKELPVENLINNMLYDDILRTIFDRHFDAICLFKLRFVCYKWQQIIEPLFALKKAIRLSESNDNFKSRQIRLATVPTFEADLQIDNITQLSLNSAHSFARLLIRAEKFAFNYTSDYSPIDVSPFFQTMTTLTTVILNRLPHDKMTNRKILLSLNNLSGLTHLHLCNMHEIYIPDKMTVLAQLKVFKLDYCNSNFFSSIANQLGSPLKRLELCGTSFNVVYLVQKRYPELKHLKLLNTRVEFLDENIIKLVPQISEKLPLLESLYLSISESYHFISAMTSLSQLKHLKELSLLQASCEDLLQAPTNLPYFSALKSLDLQFSTWKPSIESFLFDVIAIMCPLLENFNLYDARLQMYNIKKLKKCVHLKEIITHNPEYKQVRQRFESVKVIHKLRD